MKGEGERISLEYTIEKGMAGARAGGVSKEGRKRRGENERKHRERREREG